MSRATKEKAMTRLNNVPKWVRVVWQFYQDMSPDHLVLLQYDRWWISYTASRVQPTVVISAFSIDDVVEQLLAAGCRVALHDAYEIAEQPGIRKRIDKLGYNPPPDSPRESPPPYAPNVHKLTPPRGTPQPA